MKKYLGSIFVACVCLLLFFICPLALAFAAISAEISLPTVMIALFCIFAVAIGTLYVKKFCPQLYNWGRFDEKGIQIKNGGQRYFIEYKKCKSIGIGLYAHGFQSKIVGIRVYYIFFTYDKFDEKYRANMNLWKPSDTRIKVRFSKRLYHYLLTVLPEYQANALKHDYEMIRQYSQKDKSTLQK